MFLKELRNTEIGKKNVWLLQVRASKQYVCGLDVPVNDVSTMNVRKGGK